jgi:hypothetical protein
MPPEQTEDVEHGHGTPELATGCTSAPSCAARPGSPAPEGLQQFLLTPPPEPDHAQVVVRYAPSGQAAHGRQRLPFVGPRADLLLGVDPATRRRERELVLQRGSVVVLYTDGLIERQDQDLDLDLGLRRLQ